MTFTENSALVKTWVRLIQSGTYTVDAVPDLGNLKEIVKMVLDEA